MVVRVCRVPLTAAVLCGAGLLACGGGTGAFSPSAPPTPTPTPAPAPTPTPVASFVCPLPPSTNLPDYCPKLKAKMGDYVSVALDRVLATRPELFNFNDMAGPNPKVLDREEYHEAVKLELEKQGICTIVQKEEIAIKNTNEYNEQWNIWTSGGYVMRKYVTTCLPAWW